MSILEEERGGELSRVEREESGETAVGETAAEVVTSPPSVVEEHPLFKRIEQGDLESIQNFLEVG